MDIVGIGENIIGIALNTKGDGKLIFDRLVADQWEELQNSYMKLLDACIQSLENLLDFPDVLVATCGTSEKAP